MICATAINSAGQRGSIPVGHACTRYSHRVKEERTPTCNSRNNQHRGQSKALDYLL